MATEHFTWRELDRYGDRTPEAERNLLELAENLEVLRREIGKPISITPHGGLHGPTMDKHHKRSKGSQHRKGTAADITVKGISPLVLKRIVLRLIKEGKMKQGGVGAYSGFLHYDIRGRAARWGK